MAGGYSSYQGFATATDTLVLSRPGVLYSVIMVVAGAAGSGGIILYDGTSTASGTFGVLRVGTTNNCERQVAYQLKGLYLNRGLYLGITGTPSLSIEYQ